MLKTYYFLRENLAPQLSWGQYNGPFFQKISIDTVEVALAKSESADPLERERERWRVFQKLLGSFVLHNKFYSSLLHSKKIILSDIKVPKDIALLPILAKQIMRNQRMSHLTSSNIAHTRIRKETTSGSTGEPFAFVSDKNFSPFMKANFYRPWRWAGANPYAPVVNCAGEGLARATPNTLHLSPNYTHSHLEKYAADIQKINAHAIRGFPLTNFELGKALWESGYRDIRFPYAFFMGNTLSDGVRRFFTEKFESEVYDIYGLQEFGIVASECREHSGMHFFEESFILEVVDDEGKIVPDRKFGNIIITSLLNEAFPFVRYAPGDRGKLISELCGCGRTLQRLILDGRDEELIMRPDGERVSSISIRGIMSKYFNFFERYQIYQPQVHTVVLSIVPTPAFIHEHMEHATSQLKTLLGSDIRIETNIVPSIPLTQQGKLRFIISDVWRNWYEKEIR